MTTKIEWCEQPGTVPETWNPVTGCTKVSEGCRNCYAERMAKRLAGRFGYPEAPHNFDVTLHPDKLEQPLRWKKPRTVFVCSMSDLFHEDIPPYFQVSIWRIIAKTPRHTYIILTKRATRMLYRMRVLVQANGVLPNVWGMVSVESQDYTWRIGELLQTPFAVRGVSLEPLLGAVDISDALNGMPEPYGGGHRGYVSHDMALDAEDPSLEGESLGWQEPEWQQTAPPLDWGVVGGESGPGARPMHPDWARRIRDQFQAAGKPFFFKQWGAWKEIQIDKRDRGDALVSPCEGVIDRLPDPFLNDANRDDFKRVVAMSRVGKKAAGRLLDGREWNEWPEAR